MPDWDYRSILLWSSVTLVAYGVSLLLFQKARGNSLLHPLPVAVLLVLGILILSDTSIEQYRQGTGWLDWLLGPATVALAIPLFRQSSIILTLGRRGLIPILIGGLLAPVIALAVAFGMNMEPSLSLNLLTKSITTPLALESTALIGGLPEIAAGLVIITGILGAVVATPLFALLKVRSHQAQGLALGTVAHAVGTARAFQISERCGALATLALCVNGIVTSVVLAIWYLVFKS